MAPVFYHEGKFPPDDLIDWPRLIPFLGTAAAAVARYDGMLAAIPNPGVLLAPLFTQEAVLSSRIEGTQATMGEVLEFEAGQGTRFTCSSRRHQGSTQLSRRHADCGRDVGKTTTIETCYLRCTFCVALRSAR